MSYSEREQEFLRRIGVTIRRFRQERGWSQEVLARKSQVGRSYLATMERGGQNFAALNLLQVAEALGVGVAELLPEEPSDETSTIKMKI